MPSARPLAVLGLAAFAPFAAAGSNAAAPSPAAVPAGAYTVDKAHTSLIFRVNHMGFSNYTARFTRIEAQLQFDPANLGAARVGFSAHGSLRRSEFGVSFGIPAPGTQLGVSDEVAVTLETEFNGPAFVAKAQ